MKKINNVPFVVLKGTECDREKKRFAYIKTPLKGFYYVPSEIERKGRTLLLNRFIPALLRSLEKEKGFVLHYGIATSAWNWGLTWRPINFIEIFNDKKTFEIDFGKFAGRYAALRSYYSKSLAKFYASLSFKKIIFRKVKLLPKTHLTYDDHYLAGFFVKQECVFNYIRKYAPRNAKKFLTLKKEYYSIFLDIKKLKK